MLNIRWDKIDLCIPEHFIWDHVGVSQGLPPALEQPKNEQPVSHWALGCRGKVSYPEEAALALLKPSESQWFVTERDMTSWGRKRSSARACSFGPHSHPSKVTQQSLNKMARNTKHDFGRLETPQSLPQATGVHDSQRGPSEKERLERERNKTVQESRSTADHSTPTVFQGSPL